MIVTVTLNPSIDIRYTLEELTLGGVNRVKNIDKTAGGKGINVARVIFKLDKSPLTTGFVGGYLGQEFIHKLNTQHILNDFQIINSPTRNCINILHNGKSTEILESGPTINNSDWEDFKMKFKKITATHKIICISGSLPKGIPETGYNDLVSIANQNQCKVLLDTSGKALLNSLECPPFFIKPNLEEFEKLVNKRLFSIDEIILEGKKLINTGINIIAITLGSKGAVLITKNQTYIAKIPVFKVLNTVGCGDAFVGGFAVGLQNNSSLEEVFKLAIACSLSNALLPGTGDISPTVVKDLIKQVTIIKK